MNMDEGVFAQTADPQDKTILVVEVDKVQRELYQKMLREQGFQVEAADSAEATLEKAKTRKLDLILLEFYLPGKSGFEVLKELQVVEGKSTTILVWASRSVDDHLLAQIKREPNVHDFISKSTQLSVFVNMLHKILGTRPSAAPKTEDTGGFGRTTGGFGTKKGW
ncbi:MAG: response regulator [Elusimicrobiota bacterium]